MPRLDVELTSQRDDGTWTWRAAGAREPKGAVDGSLLPDGAAVGDVLQADADVSIDGITLTGVLPPKEKRPEPETITVLGSGNDGPPVTTSLRKKRGRDGRRRKGGRGGSADGQGKGRRPTERKPPAEPRPKPKRLRPGREHRNAVLAGLPDDQKVVAEQLVRGGIPAVRKAIDEQNAQLAKENRPTIAPDAIVTLAEQLLPSIREAEWRDRADAALAGADEVDLRDLRSVVTAAEAGARGAEARAVADQLRDAVTKRVDDEHRRWLQELAGALGDGRAVRALRLSSRPPKAGAPLPPDVATQLSEAAARSLTADTGSDRYALVVDALAFSPVRERVTPLGVPTNPSDELTGKVQKLADRVPAVAAAFGIETRPTTTAKPPPPPPPAPPSAPTSSTPPGPPPDTTRSSGSSA